MAVTGVPLVQPDRPFRILVSNLGTQKNWLPERQLIAWALHHRTVVLPRQLSTAELLGISRESEIIRSGNSLDSRLQLAPEQPEGPDELSPSTESLIPEHAHVLYREPLREMVGKHSSMCTGPL